MIAFSGRAAAAAVMLAALSLPAHAGLVTDGNFTSVTAVDGGVTPGGVCYQTTPTSACSTLGGWTNTDGYTFISNSANLGLSAYGNYNVALDAFPTGPAGAPALGTNYLAVDGVAWGAPRGTISQTLSGLTVGDHYAVTFWQAAAQQTAHSGATTEQWVVSLGSQTDYSTLMNTPSQGTYAWNQQTLVFTATLASEVLTFTSLGTPDGDPPFVLLDDVSATDIPEPSAIAALSAGMAMLLLRRRTRAAS
jgi:hypothetical protein